MVIVAFVRSTAADEFPAIRPTEGTGTKSPDPSNSNFTIDRLENIDLSTDAHKDPKSERNKPDVVNLRNDVVKLLQNHEYDKVKTRVTETINNAIQSIRSRVLSVLAKVVEDNFVLLDNLEPAYSCVKSLHWFAGRYINYVVTQAYLNTHEYKKIDWKTRYPAANLSTKNVQDEICTLESQINAFTRDVISDIYRLAHIGFNLHNAPQDHGRYVNYLNECKETTKFYKTPDMSEEKKTDFKGRKRTPAYAILQTIHYHYPGGMYAVE